MAATITVQQLAGQKPMAPTFVDRIRVQDKTILTLLNDAVAQYEAHRVTVSPAVHGAADATMSSRLNVRPRRRLRPSRLSMTSRRCTRHTVC